MRGMHLLDLKDILSTHYEQSKIEFIVASKLKAEEFLKIFQNINYTSPNENIMGSQRTRDKEEDVMYNFTNFLESLQEEDYVIKTIAIDEYVEIDAEKKISLNDLVRFCIHSAIMIAKGTISYCQYMLTVTFVSCNCKICWFCLGIC